jgi:hypothetical protein
MRRPLFESGTISHSDTSPHIANEYYTILEANTKFPEGGVFRFSGGLAPEAAVFGEADGLGYLKAINNMSG